MHLERAVGRFPGLVVVLFLFSLSAACSDSPSSGGLAGLARWTAEQDLRVGSVDDPAYSLTRFGYLAVGETGRMYTAHDREEIVRVFEPDGKLLGTIGGKGEGPGEFQGIGPIGWAGDSLWVLDISSYRFSFFSEDGEFLSSFLIPFEFQTGPDDPFPPRPGGILSDGTVHGSLSAGSRDVTEGTVTHRQFLILSREGEVTNLVDSIPYGRNLWGVAIPDDPRQRMMYPAQPFGDGPIGGFHPNEPAFSVLEREAAAGMESAAFRISKLTSMGDTVFSREYPYTPIPISNAEIDSTMNAQADQWEEWGIWGGVSAAQFRLWAEPTLFAPSFRPPMTEMILGRDGGYWLRGIPTAGDSVEWYALDSSGTPLGSVQLPVGFTMLAGDTATVWGSEQDEFDVPYLVRFKIRRGGV